MSDLISRKVLLEVLEDYGFNQDTMIPIISLMKVLEIIEEQPTAYDVEKVVEGLELENKRLKTLRNNCIALCDHEVIGIENKAYDYAIKIVRNGGKDE